MSSWNTIIFDLDGTLLDTLADLRTAVNRALAEFGYPERSREDIRLAVGNGTRVLMRESVPGGEDNPQFEELIGAFKKHYADCQFDTTVPYDGIPELLAVLAERGIRTALVSNKIDFAVQDLNNKFFRLPVAVGDRPEFARKPAPDSVLFAMNQLDADPETTVYIGDSEVDLETAKNAGIACISALWGFRTRKELEAAGAAVYAETPLDLLQML